MARLLYCLCFLLPGVAALAAGAENRLRNGSFEGGLLCWHNLDPQQVTLVHDAAVGEFALRLGKAFVAVCGEPMTVSFFVIGEQPGRVGVPMPPSAREVGTKGGTARDASLPRWLPESR